MKKFVKISVVFLVLLLCIYNTCFADVVSFPFESHGSDYSGVYIFKTIVILVYFVILGIYIARCIIRNKKLKENKENAKPISGVAIAFLLIATAFVITVFFIR